MDALEAIDLIYEAATDGSVWPRVVDAVAQLMGGDGGALLVQDQLSKASQSVVVGLDPDVGADYAAYYGARNPYTRRNLDRMRNFRPRLVLDEEIVPLDEVARTEYYAGFKRRFDLGATAMLALAAQAGELVTLNIMRSFRHGEFEPDELELAQRLHPHLLRSVRLCRVLGVRDRLLTELIERSPQAVLVVDADARIVAATRLAEQMLAARDALTVEDGRLAARNGAGRRLQALIARATRLDGIRAGGTLQLAAADERLPLSLEVAPLAPEQAELLSGPTSLALVVAVGFEPPDSAADARLSTLFGLTDAERRVASALARGLSTRDIADAFGVSLATVRTHLYRIFRKTGVGRQAELVRLLMRLQAGAG